MKKILKREVFVTDTLTVNGKISFPNYKRQYSKKLIIRSILDIYSLNNKLDPYYIIFT